MDNTGFQQESHSLYFKTKDGKIVVTIRKDRLDDYSDIAQIGKLHEYLNKEGIPVVDIRLDSFTGHLKSIKVIETTFGKVWNITFTDNSGRQYAWSTFYDGMLIQGFVNALASIEDSKIGLIKILPWLDSKAKTPTTKLVVYHNDNKLSWKYKPEELPPITPLKDENGDELFDAKGNKLYNKKARMKWLIDEVMKIEKILNGNGSSKGTKHEVKEEDVVGPEVNEDTQPF